MDERVYFDHNATTPLDPRVLEEMLPWLSKHHGNPSSIHLEGVQSRVAIERARRAIAKAINAAPEEILFTSGGTESNNLALRGFVQSAFRLGKRPHLLTSNADHAAVRETLQDLAGLFSLPIMELCVDDQARLSPDLIAGFQLGDDALLSILAANNEVGSLNDVKALFEACDAKTSIFKHVDAVQALGKIPVDVRCWGCDSAAFASHKVYGPKGVGFLFLRSGLELSPISTGGGQEAHLRGGTENVAGIVGMAAAVRIAIEELEDESIRLAGLRDLLWNLVKASVPSAICNTPVTDSLPNTLNMSFPGRDGRALVRELDERGFAVSAASACSSSGMAISHVLKAMTTDEVRQRGAVRFSLGRSSTEGAVRRLASALGALEGGVAPPDQLR